MWLQTVTLPLVGLGFLSLSWEILSALYRWVSGVLGLPWALRLCCEGLSRNGVAGAVPEGVIGAWRDTGIWRGVLGRQHGVGAQPGGAG